MLPNSPAQAELTAGVADLRLADYLRWWIEEEAPKGKPGRAPLAAATVRGYRSNIDNHIIPGLVATGFPVSAPAPW